MAVSSLDVKAMQVIKEPYTFDEFVIGLANESKFFLSWLIRTCICHYFIKIQPILPLFGKSMATC